MTESLRALIYILAIALPVFFVARRIAVPLICENDFRIWHNCWLLTTSVVFLSPSFALYALALVPITIYARRHTALPCLIYLLLMFTAPSLSVEIRVPGLMVLLGDLNPARLLALLVLLPETLRLLENPENKVLNGADLLVGAFVLLMILLAGRDLDLAAMARAVPAYTMDILLPYFVFSRSLRTAREVNQALLAFAIAIMPLAAIGAFEVWKVWRLYYVVIDRWEFRLLAPYLMRDGMLRAAATCVEPIAFGFLCMTGAGCLLAIRGPEQKTIWRYAALMILLIGLLASISRGPWLGFALCAMLMLATNLRNATRAAMLLIPGSLLLAVFASPHMMERFVNLLPFVGHADPGSETYRSNLFENAMIVIGRNPFFGSNDFLGEPEMRRMIQGQGIIDIVNSYLQIALEFGLVTLFIFVLFFFLIGAKLASRSIKADANAPNYMGALAVLLAMLFTIATTSSVSVIPYLYWTFGGLCAGLTSRRLAQTRTERTERSAPVPTMRVLGGRA